VTTLRKLHGLGNDFLVTFDLSEEIDAVEFARSVCDRRRGIGADGLLIGSAPALDQPSGVDVVMRLLNADGSPAEMSGNGIRCFAQAWIEHRGAAVPSTVAVATDAGLRTVEIRSHDGTTMVSSVEMGEVSDTHEPIDWAKTGCHPDRPVRHLSLGNPHAVVGVDDVAVVDLEGLGSVVPGVNLEIVEPGPGPHEVRMRVHERGVGITEACGTGACATAVAALEWGLVTADANGEVTVHMDGGTVTVSVDRGTRTAVLSGPSVAVATVEIEPR